MNNSNYHNVDFTKGFYIFGTAWLEQASELTVAS